MRARPPGLSAARAIVASSTERMLSAPAAFNRSSMVAASLSPIGRVLLMIASAVISVRASPAKVCRTLWITDRIATIAPTPTAMQMKNTSRRRHDARSSRAAM